MKSIDDRKLRYIMLSAKSLFWKFGFKRVTIEEICREANVSKMTFYKHFKNKKELIIKLMNFITDKAMKQYREIMDSDIPFTEKVKKSVDIKLESTNDMSNAFYDDYFRHADAEMQEFMNQKMNENMQMILQDYTDAQKRGDIRKNIKPEFILYFLNHLFEMAKDVQLKNIYDTPQKMIMELINFFFYGILPHDKARK